MEKIKIMTVFGTRPEAIKMAPVALELKKYSQEIEPIVAVTAQHREMLDQVLNLFDIKPDYDLDIMSHGQTLFDITSRALTGLGEVIAKEKPDMVLVHGDTTTTFAGALAAFYHQIPVGHVEAGLRTGNKYSPFPEEMNRKLTGAVTDIHFAPTTVAKANLLAEGIDTNNIFVTGNTVIDALKETVKKEYHPTGLPEIDWHNKRIILITTHRRENLGDKLRQVYLALKDIVRDFADIEIVFPIHKNPAVREIADEVLGKSGRVHFIEPLDYQPFAWAMSKAYLVMTDSGGIQEEAPALGKPVLVLRDTTERPEAIEAGTVKLTGTIRETVYADTAALLKDECEYQKMANAVNPYGDGWAARRIVENILWRFGFRQQKADEFIVTDR